MRAQQYESLTTWYYISCYAFLLIGGVLFTINLYQSIQIISAIKQNKQLLAQKTIISSIAQSVSSLEQQEKKLQQQLGIIHSYESSCALPLSLLKIISASIPLDVALTRCSYQHSKQLQIEGDSCQLQSLTHFMNNLQNNAILKLALIDSLSQTVDSQKNIPLIHFKLMAWLN